MFKLKNSGLTPTCGWSFTVQETKVTVYGENLSDLVDKAISNLKINGVSSNRLTLTAYIEDDLCKRSVSGMCNGFMNLRIPTARQVLNGTTAMIIMIKRGKGAFVSLTKAEERAEKCLKCPYHVANPGCMGCSSFKVVINSVRRGRQSKLDDQLKTCGVCGCFTQALVHVDADILKVTTDKRELMLYPDECWKKQEINKLNEEK